MSVVFNQYYSICSIFSRIQSFPFVFLLKTDMGEKGKGQFTYFGANVICERHILTR